MNVREFSIEDWQDRALSAEAEVRRLKEALRHYALWTKDESSDLEIRTVRNRHSRGRGIHYVQATGHTDLCTFFTICGVMIGSPDYWEVVTDQRATCGQCLSLYQVRQQGGG